MPVYGGSTVQVIAPWCPRCQQLHLKPRTPGIFWIASDQNTAVADFGEHKFKAQDVITVGALAEQIAALAKAVGDQPFTQG